MNVEPSARFAVRTPAVMWDEIGGEIVAINLTTGHYFSLRTTAREMFTLLAEGRSIDEIVGVFADVHDADVVRTELAAFVDELLERGLLESRRDDPQLDAAASSSAYTTPLLEAYTDLEDLMLLDPVHDVDGMGWPRARTEV